MLFWGFGSVVVWESWENRGWTSFWKNTHIQSKPSLCRFSADDRRARAPNAAALYINIALSGRNTIINLHRFARQSARPAHRHSMLRNRARMLTEEPVLHRTPGWRDESKVRCFMLCTHTFSRASRKDRGGGRTKGGYRRCSADLCAP